MCVCVCTRVARNKKLFVKQILCYPLLSLLYENQMLGKQHQAEDHLTQESSLKHHILCWSHISAHVLVPSESPSALFLSLSNIFAVTVLAVLFASAHFPPSFLPSPWQLLLSFFPFCSVVQDFAELVSTLAPPLECGTLPGYLIEGSLSPSTVSRQKNVTTIYWGLQFWFLGCQQREQAQNHLNRWNHVPHCRGT